MRAVKVAVVGVLTVGMLAGAQATASADEDDRYPRSYRDVCQQSGISKTPGGEFVYILYKGNNVNVRSIANGYAEVNYPTRGYVPARDLCPRR